MIFSNKIHSICREFCGFTILLEKSENFDMMPKSKETEKKKINLEISEEIRYNNKEYQRDPLCTNRTLGVRSLLEWIVVLILAALIAGFHIFGKIQEKAKTKQILDEIEKLDAAEGK